MTISARELSHMNEVRNGKIHWSHKRIEYLRSDPNHDYKCLDCGLMSGVSFSWGDLIKPCVQKK